MVGGRGEEGMVVANLNGPGQRTPLIGPGSVEPIVNPIPCQRVMRGPYGGGQSDAVRGQSDAVRGQTLSRVLCDWGHSDAVRGQSDAIGGQSDAVAVASDFPDLDHSNTQTKPVSASVRANCTLAVCTPVTVHWGAGHYRRQRISKVVRHRCQLSKSKAKFWEGCRRL